MDGSKAVKRKMEKQTEKETKPEGESGKESLLEGLPLEDSPYLKYKNLEDYKLQGYGTQGHQQPNPGRGAGSTDAPTLSGSDVSSEAQVNAADATNRKRAP